MYRWAEPSELLCRGTKAKKKAPAPFGGAGAAFRVGWLNAGRPPLDNQQNDAQNQAEYGDQESDVSAGATGEAGSLNAVTLGVHGGQDAPMSQPRSTKRSLQMVASGAASRLGVAAGAGKDPGPGAGSAPGSGSGPRIRLASCIRILDPDRAGTTMTRAPATDNAGALVDGRERRTISRRRRRPRHFWR
jgi:hypothetical protein